MKCRLCGSEARKVFKAKIMGKYQIKYYECGTCKLLQTEQPYWLEEAYANPINNTDTGLVSRNIILSKKVSVILYNLFKEKGKYIDYGGGYGLFVRLMRDMGFDFFWSDPYTQNLFVKGFEYKKEQEYDALTALELFEHLVNPSEEIEKMFKLSDTIILSTNLYNSNLHNPNNWWYFGKEHGQHVAFYSKETLEFIAKKYNKNLFTNGKNLHVLSSEKIPAIRMKILLKISKFEPLRKRIIKTKSKTLDDMNVIIKNGK